MPDWILTLKQKTTRILYKPGNMLIVRTQILRMELIHCYWTSSGQYPFIGQVSFNLLQGRAIPHIVVGSGGMAVITTRQYTVML